MVDEKTFKARLNKMPPPRNILQVTGVVTVPTTGWFVGLVKAVPQGVNPAILILEVMRIPPDQQGGDLVMHIPVLFGKYESPDYTDVTIRDGKDEFTIPVKVVH